MIILFVYIHINDQYKKSEDLEIYEMDYVSNAGLQNICNVKQPTIFDFRQIYPDIFSKLEKREHFEKFENIDVKVKDVLDYWNPTATSIDPIILPIQSFQTLMKSDPKSHFFMEDNQDFLEETELLPEIRELDAYLKPSFSIRSKYDLITGSNSCITPLRYHTDYRRYMIVASGKISVKMTPWRSRKHLHPVIDYDNYEFFSKLNPWMPQKEYLNDMDKLKFLDFEVAAGNVLYIPPFWWYSIKFTTNDTQVVSISYQTVMNIFSNIPDICRYYLQFHNTKVKISRTLDIPSEIAVVDIDK
jgi:hypothetical protein